MRDFQTERRDTYARVGSADDLYVCGSVFALLIVEIY